MKALIKFWKSITPEHRDYVFVYLSALAWAVSYLIYTPAATSGIVDSIILFLWLGVAALGAVLALLGIIKKDNLLTEKLGVTFLMTVPMIYVLLQVSIIIYYIIVPEDAVTPWEARLNLIFLGLWLFFFLNKRRRQLARQVRAANNTPLPDESPEDGKK